MGDVSDKEKALVAIGRFLGDSGYAFTAITPASHALVNARARAGETLTLRDIFGWSLPFGADALPPFLFSWLEKSGELERAGESQSGAGKWRSRIRYSTLKGGLYVHSAFPTVEADSVFFGPDTYRFADLIERTISGSTGRIGRVSGPVRNILDIGCGSGAGGLLLAGNPLCRGARVFLSDINFRALRFARVNGMLGGKGNASVVLGDTTRALKGPMDIILSNPPYLVDAEARLYRDGGGVSGCDLSVRIVRESIPLLAPGGRLILYTGTPVVEGRHIFREAVAPVLDAPDIEHEYAELDPDVFGEELAHPAYASAERLAAVSLVLRRRDR